MNTFYSSMKNLLVSLVFSFKLIHAYLSRVWVNRDVRFSLSFQSTSIIRVEWSFKRLNRITDLLSLKNVRQKILILVYKNQVEYFVEGFLRRFLLIRLLFFVFVLFQSHSFFSSRTRARARLVLSISSFFSRLFSNNGSTCSPYICRSLTDFFLSKSHAT